MIRDDRNAMAFVLAMSRGSDATVRSDEESVGAGSVIPVELESVGWIRED